jgi:hypothetical protein
MKEIKVLKKNRKFFAIELENGYNAKLVIDESSENLEPGTYTLDLEDISIRSKYGTDLRFKMKKEVKSFCFFKPVKFNRWAQKECQDLGGKWDSEEKCWVFPDYVSDKVEDLEKYNDLIPVEITINDDIYESQDAITLGGQEIAKASGRDSGARVCDGVSVIEGGFSSGGSIANWKTTAMAGTVFRTEIPRFVADEEFDNDDDFDTLKKL